MNYDAQQIYSLLSTFIKYESDNQIEVKNDPIIQGWNKEIDCGNILRIERLNITEEDDNDRNSSNQDDEDDTNKEGHDFLINTNRDEHFVISLSTDREEICVWNVLT